jgi:hypothetical protein
VCINSYLWQGGVPLIPDEFLWRWVADREKPGVPVSIGTWLRALAWEVHTRFVVHPQRQGKPRRVPRRSMRRALHLIRWGMMVYPRVQYLQLQYIAMLIADIGSFPEGSRLPQLAKASKAIDLLSSRMTRTSAYTTCALIQLRRALERAKVDSDGSAGKVGGADTLMSRITEVRRVHTQAVSMHMSCRAQLGLIWRHLRTAAQDVPSAQVLGEHLDRMRAAETAASKSYQFVLDRCNDSRVVWEEYARFLREIKHDVPAAKHAKEIAERCFGIDVDVDSAAASDGPAKLGIWDHPPELSPEANNRSWPTAGDAAGRAMQTWLRALTVLLTLLLAVLLVLFVVFDDKLELALCNIAEAGELRALVADTAAVALRLAAFGAALSRARQARDQQHLSASAAPARSCCSAYELCVCAAQAVVT